MYIINLIYYIKGIKVYLFNFIMITYDYYKYFDRLLLYYY